MVSAYKPKAATLKPSAIHTALTFAMKCHLYYTVHIQLLNTTSQSIYHLH